jgi:hypothetical protein
MLGLGEGTTRGTTNKMASGDAAPARPRASLWVLMIGIIAVLSAGTLARRPASRK